jgi:hypothetical protein
VIILKATKMNKIKELSNASCIQSLVLIKTDLNVGSLIRYILVLEQINNDKLNNK